MSTLNFYLKKSKGVLKINSKGKAPVYLQYTHDSKTCYFSTRVMIRPGEFNFNKEQIRLTRTKNHSLEELQKQEILLNKEIHSKREKIQGKINDLVFEGVPPSVLILKERLSGNSTNKLNHDWGICFDAFKTNSIGVSSSTMRNYNTLNSTIQRYLNKKSLKSLLLTDIDFKFYASFCSFMERDLNLSKNSIGERVKRLKAFLNHSKRLGYTVFDRLEEFKVYSEPKTIVYCSLEEINHLMNYDLSENKKLEKVRDIFVVGCHTGLRVSDLLRLTIDHISDGLFIVKTMKTNKIATPPVSPYSLHVLNKYGGEMPKISDVKYNKYLKELGKEVGFEQLVELPKYNKGKKSFIKVPKWELMSSHVAVKSFITNCAVNHVNMNVVRVSTGKSIKVILSHYQAVGDSFLKSEINKIF
jgi:site-specific recombinase XerC